MIFEEIILQLSQVDVHSPIGHLPIPIAGDAGPYGPLSPYIVTAGNGMRGEGADTAEVFYPLGREAWGMEFCSSQQYPMLHAPCANEVSLAPCAPKAQYGAGADVSRFLSSLDLFRFLLH